MKLGKRPLVSVEHAFAGPDSNVNDDWFATCSEHGDLTDPGGLPKDWHQRQAWLHAEAAHDGDVDRAGWV